MNRRSRRGASLIVLLSIGVYHLLTLTGCADVFGFREGQLSNEPCHADSDCGAQEECRYAQCVSRTCATVGERRCDGLRVVRCEPNQQWKQQQACDTMCRHGECRPANSCEAPAHGTVCADGASCCTSIALPNATFKLPYVRQIRLGEQETESTEEVTRTIREVALDRFEVTVSRFRSFVDAFDVARKPEVGAGAHPAFPDSGWKEEWNVERGPIAESVDSLFRELRARDQELSGDVAENLPVRGVSWYVAFAFCIWDEGRLPTEAEWAYAALGGDERRAFPWVSDWDGQIDHAHAVYSDEPTPEGKPELVGTHREGQGALGHEDLAGNVQEWLADAFEGKLPTTCAAGSLGRDDHECLQTEVTDGRVVRGGGFGDPPIWLRNVARSWNDPDSGLRTGGLRCARDLASEL